MVCRYLWTRQPPSLNFFINSLNRLHKMKKAYLYIRVSTDEQADTGYSQRSQDEMLRRYCDINNIAVVEAFFEDHSAKNFNRPQFTRLLTGLRKKRGQADLILFTKWDRFSRNAGD